MRAYNCTWAHDVEHTESARMGIMNIMDGYFKINEKEEKEE